MSGYMEYIKNHRPHLSFIIQATSFTVFTTYLFTSKPVEPEIDVSFPASVIDNIYAKFILSSAWNIPVIGVKSLQFFQPSLLTGLVCFFLFWIIELNTFIKWIFSLPPFLILGKASFGLYLLHDGIENFLKTQNLRLIYLLMD